METNEREAHRQCERTKKSGLEGREMGGRRRKGGEA